MSTPSTSWLLDPLDTMFFREGRAFQAGEASDVRSVFPPPPSAIQGIVRSKLLAEHCRRLNHYSTGCTASACDHLSMCTVRGVAGERDVTEGSLRIRGPWIVRDAQGIRTWFLPVPADLVADEAALAAVSAAASDEIQTVLLGPVSSPSPKELGRLRRADGQTDAFVPVRGWMAWEAWQLYLAGVAPTLHPGMDYLTDSAITIAERRPGVQIEKGRNRAEDQQLYFAEHVRLRAGDARLLIGFECVGIPADLTDRIFPVCTVGGEMRAAGLELAEPPPWSTSVPVEVESVLTSGAFKLVLVQPAYFTQGWRPALSGLDVVAAVVGRAIPTGGWDAAKRQEKEVRPLAPAGSVYFCEGTLERSQLDAMWNQSVSESHGGWPSYPHMGFGHAFVGCWPALQGDDRD